MEKFKFHSSDPQGATRWGVGGRDPNSTLRKREHLSKRPDCFQGRMLPLVFGWTLKKNSLTAQEIFIKWAHPL